MKISTALSIIFICITPFLFAQGKYVTKTGEITFEASVPSFEEVKAKNTNVSAILNSETGEFATLALIKGFRFKIALMEEHFNENYIESSKYPKATFKGKINDFDVSMLSEEEKEYTIVGTLNIHGVDKLLETPVIISIVDNCILLDLDLILKPSDFNIKIPAIVRSKIAEEVDIKARYSLKK